MFVQFHAVSSVRSFYDGGYTVNSYYRLAGCYGLPASHFVYTGIELSRFAAVGS
jgi:hypothetical protein